MGRETVEYIRGYPQQWYTKGSKINTSGIVNQTRVKKIVT